jgi:hypothetical protein
MVIIVFQLEIKLKLIASHFVVYFGHKFDVFGDNKWLMKMNIVIEFV